MDGPQTYLDLFDYRCRVFEMYRKRNQAIREARDGAAVHEEFRTARDELFAWHPQSALPSRDREGFTGLRYFPYDTAACVEATLHIEVATARLAIGTSGEQSMPMTRVARLHFSFEGTPGELSLYWIDVYGGGLFLPFRDATARDETYGGGRYLFDTVKGSDFLWSSESNGERRMALDFNYAYNPSCAYDERWACPLAPRENWLPFPVRAGERRYEPPPLGS